MIMIKLSKKEITKIKGYAHYYSESYEHAIRYLEKLDKDAQAYELIANSYMYLREYKLAQEYALKAIELGRDSAYVVYTRVTTANLDRKDIAFAQLTKGVSNHSSQACVALANLGLDFSGPQVRNMNTQEVIDLLEKAWKYNRSSTKGLVALQIATSYKTLCHPNKVDFFTNIDELKAKAAKYFRLANDYGYKYGQLNEEMFSCLSEQTPPKEKKAILHSLFEHFDHKVALYFGLLMIQNGPKKIYSSGESWMLFGYGTGKGDNACALLYGLIYGSHLPGSSFDYNATKDLLQIVYGSKSKSNVPSLIHVPSSLKSTYLSLIDEYDAQFNHYLKELKVRIYDTK